MANITEILGKDSISSSRITLNNNFNLLNDELSELSDLLNTEDESLTISGAISASNINVPGILDINSSVISLKQQATFEEIVTLENGMIKSTSSNPITILPEPGEYKSNIYFLDSSLSGQILSDAFNGQEITLVAPNGNIVINSSNIIGVSALTIKQNGTLTLFFNNGNWYVVSSFNCDITIDII